MMLIIVLKMNILMISITVLVITVVVYSCVRSAMLYGSETWCLGQNEMGILQRTERAMVRNMCGVKLMDK